MAAELVRYEGDGPSFTETVADFAGIIHPLVGLSRLVSKVMAARVESQRLQAQSRRDRNSHELHMAQVKGQERVADRHSQRLVRVERERIRADERADIRQAAVSLRQLEIDFDTAMQAIRSEGTIRRHEIDRHYAAQIQRVDADLRVRLAAIARQRHHDDQVFAQQRRRLRSAEAAQAEIRAALRESTRLMGSRSRFTEIAAVTTESLARTLSTMQIHQQDPVAALLGNLAGLRTR
ncbi:hypothetical protein Dvina_50460 [Dactylosporangium vinaceum]|uniref:hypothetical protein n=1 Tax=Dactylosporangium vinaceum TaxID=53362 RepID=UPI001CA7E0F9|nr:hypothetical protein [Dactylosporangium vinaceum]UAB96088.1 hypothetical protein Dvina_50460 [Dactylosporangium vinaceum]